MNEFTVISNAFKSIPGGLAKVVSNPFWSVMGAAIAATSAFLFGEAMIGYAFAGLLVIDGFTGWMKARKNKEKPDSGKLGEKTLAKLVVYLVPLLGWSLLEIMLEGTGLYKSTGLHPVHVAIVGWIGAREMISILENLNTLYGEDYDIIRRLYNRVKGIEEKFADIVGKNDDDKKE